MANNVSLLQHQIGKFGVVTVMDAVLFEHGTVKPVLKLDTLKVSSVSAEGSTKEIRGGMAADLLLTYNHSRSVNLEMTDALVSLYSLSALWGSPVKSLVNNYYKTMETAVAVAPTQQGDPVANPFITEGTPSTCFFYKKNDDGSYTNEIGENTGPVIGVDYFVTDEEGKDMSVQNATWVAGKTYYGYGYAMGVAAGSGEDYKNPVEIVLKSKSFPDALTLVGKTSFIDEQTGKKVIAEIEIPKFQFGNAFDFSMDAEGDASTFNFNGVALADGAEKELIKIRTLRIEGALDSSGSGTVPEWK